MDMYIGFIILAAISTMGFIGCLIFGGRLDEGARSLSLAMFAILMVTFSLVAAVGFEQVVLESRAVAVIESEHISSADGELRWSERVEGIDVVFGCEGEPFNKVGYCFSEPQTVILNEV